MNCSRARDRLSAYHDGELPEAEARSVARHLLVCLACRRRQQAMSRVDQAVPIPDPGPEYWDRLSSSVMDRVARESACPGESAGSSGSQAVRRAVPRPVNRFHPGWASAAAALLLAVAGGMYLKGTMRTDVAEEVLTQRAVPGSVLREDAAGQAPTTPPAPPPAGIAPSPTAPIPPPAAGTPSPTGALNAGKDGDARAAANGPPTRPVARKAARPMKMEEGKDDGAHRPAPPADAVSGESAPPARSARVAETMTAPSPPSMDIAKAGLPETAPLQAPGTAMSPVPGPPPAATPSLSRLYEDALRLSRDGRNTEAEELLAAIRLRGGKDPIYPRAMLLLARILDGSGREREADLVLVDAFALAPGDDEIGSYLRSRPHAAGHP
jgi:anti-sigma factor RsiW